MARSDEHSESHRQSRYTYVDGNVYMLNKLCEQTIFKYEALEANAGLATQQYMTYVASFDVNFVGDDKNLRGLEARRIRSHCIQCSLEQILRTELYNKQHADDEYACEFVDLFGLIWQEQIGDCLAYYVSFDIIEFDDEQIDASHGMTALNVNANDELYENTRSCPSASG